MFTKKKVERSNLEIGIVQAIGVTAYVLLFAFAASNLERLKVHPPQILAAAAFLTAFVVSALVCGSLVLAYPAVLVMQGKTKNALEIVAWSAAGLATFLLLFLAIIIMF